jgi:hypothetical protein
LFEVSSWASSHIELDWEMEMEPVGWTYYLATLVSEFILHVALKRVT